MPVIATGNAVSGTVTGVTDGILIVNNITDRTVDMVGTGTIIGMADRAGQSLATGGVDMAVMRGTQRRAAASGDPGRAVLVTGSASTGSSDIPVRCRGAVTGDGTSTGCLGVSSAGGGTGEDDFSQTVNMGGSGSTSGQSRVARRGGAVTDITGIAGIQVVDMAGGVLTDHVSAVVTVAGVAGGDTPFSAAPDRSSRGINTSRIVDTAATVGVTADTGATAVTRGGVSRVQTTAGRFDDGLERTGRSKNALERPIIMGSEEVVIVTEDAAVVVTAGHTGVRGMRCGCFILVETGGRIVERAIDSITVRTTRSGICRRGTVTAVAAGTFKAAKSASLVMHMAGTTVLGLGVRTTASSHGIGVTMTFFTITVRAANHTIGPGRICRTKGGEDHIGLGAESCCRYIFAQNIIVWGTAGCVHMRTVAGQTTDRLKGITMGFIGVTSRTDRRTTIGGILKGRTRHQRAISTEQLAITGSKYLPIGIDRGRI